LQWLAAPFPSHRPVAAAKLDAICGAASLTPPGLESLEPPSILRPFGALRGETQKQKSK